jgi:ribonucleoside-diphosphate reductase alpha chain
MSHLKPRPEALPGVTYRIKTGCGSLYVTVNDDGGQPFETFGRLGKAGGCASAVCEAIGRLVSAQLRSGVPIDVAIKQLKGIHCHASSKVAHSCPSAFGEILEKIKNEASKSERPGADGDQRSGSPSGED